MTDAVHKYFPMGWEPTVGHNTIVGQVWDDLHYEEIIFGPKQELLWAVLGVMHYNELQE